MWTEPGPDSPSATEPDGHSDDTTGSDQKSGQKSSILLEGNEYPTLPILPYLLTWVYCAHYILEYTVFCPVSYAYY